MINNIKKQNWIMLISLLLWCTVTLIRVLHHSPWYDESHAWLISQELNIFEIIKLMKIEGHTIIWYLLLMPFAKTNFMYPYSMLLLNWLFCFIAVLILWLKAPFNNWIKFLISFSFPFLALYPVVARCYSIGIMFLFAIAAQEKSKLAHPNWYALLLILCANTSVMAAVGAAVFGVIFVYELLKNKKDILQPILLLFIGIVIILFQLPISLNNNVLVSSLNMPLTINFLTSTFIENSLYFNIVLLLIFSVGIILFCIKNKIIPIFLILSYLVLFIVFSQYYGALWHHFFFYVYFIIFIWILYENNSFNNLSWNEFLLSVLIIASIFFVFWKPKNEDIRKVWNSQDLKVSKLMLSDKDIFNSNILIFEMHQSIFPIYLKGYNINVINYCSKNNVQWDIRPYYYSEVCRFDGVDNSLVLLRDDYIETFYTDNTYILTSNKIKTPDNSFTGGLKNFRFVLYKNYGQNMLWKVEKIK